VWRVVCVGPGPNDKPRRRVDKGPLMPEKARATAIAAWLRSTGLYESVTVQNNDDVKASRHTERED